MSSKVAGVAIVMFLVVLVGPVMAADPDPNLVGWWTFDDGSGTTPRDSSDYGRHGDFVGSPQWSVGHLGGALNTSAGNYVVIPGYTGILGPNPRTCTAWIKTTTADGVIIGWGLLSAGNKWIMRVNQVGGGGQLRCEVDAGYHYGITKVNDDEWHHVAVVLEDDGSPDIAEVRLYVDGVRDGDNADLADEPINTIEAMDVTIGQNPHNLSTRSFGGLLDDVRIYDRALTPQEIAALVPPQLKAFGPVPSDGNVTVVTPLLQWRAGDTALLHDVYFGTDPNLGPDDLVQSRLPMTLYFHGPGLVPGATYYWRVDEIERDMRTVHTGEVWSFTARPNIAYLPEPADGTNEGSTDPSLTLAWWPGTGAMEHHVYFGPIFTDVNEGTPDADKGTVKETTYVLPEPLQPLATYYWRIDEIVIGGAVQTGEVWSFATYLSIEDFESYTDDEGSRIYETWIDGWTNGTGSQVGYVQAPFAEQRVVHGGAQSMPLDYNNVNDPLYSEASRTWESPQNWSAGGADALVLYVSGHWRNAAEPLYVAIEDTGRRAGVVIHPDPETVTRSQWTRWDIPLRAFSDAGVNMAAVKAMHIGLGDRNAASPGGVGRVYIDDIRATKSISAVKQ